MLPLKSRALARSLSGQARYWSSVPNGHRVRPVVVSKETKAGDGSSLSDAFLLGGITIALIWEVYDAYSIFASKSSESVYSEAWHRQCQIRKDLGQNNRKGLTERKEPLFVPVWWPRKRKARPYDAESAELGTFEELNQDQGRRTKIQERLAHIAIDHVLNNRNRQISQGLGYGSVRSQIRGWFEYPIHPPPDYEQRGFRVTQSGVTWTKKTITSDSYSRMERLVLPRAMADALFAAHKSYWNHQYNRLKHSLGFKGGKETSQQPLQNVRLTPEQRQQIKDPIAFQAVIVFHNTFARSRKPPSVRGTCTVKVLLEMVGPQGRCVMMINGDYLPSKDAFVKARIAVLALHPLDPKFAVSANRPAWNGKPSEQGGNSMRLGSPRTKPEQKPPEPDGKPLKQDGRSEKADGKYSKPD